VSECFLCVWLIFFIWDLEGDEQEKKEIFFYFYHFENIEHWTFGFLNTRLMKILLLNL